MIKQFTHSIWLTLCLAAAISLIASGSVLQAQEVEQENQLYLEVSQGGGDFRTKELRKYFKHLGRDFEVFRIRSTTPTEAGKVYRLQKAWQRNRLIFTAGTAVVLALIIGIAVAGWQATVANRERNNAVDAQ